MDPVYVKDKVDLSTREITKDGFLLGRARVTKPGILEYDAGELGVGEPGRTVKVYQTPESVFHPETISSARGAAITVEHPPSLFVTPDTWKDLTVGNVIGEPSKMEDDGLGMSIFLGDRRAIDHVSEKGSQVSIGKRFKLARAAEGIDADFVTEGPLEINHLALVKSSRSGSDIKVLDSKEKTETDSDKEHEPVKVAEPDEGDKVETIDVNINKDSEEIMTPEDMKKEIAESIATGLSAGLKNQNAQIDAGVLTNAVTQAVNPITEKVEVLAKQVADDRARLEEADALSAAKEAEDKAREAADALVRETIRKERFRNDILNEALPMIPESDRDKYKDSPIKDILVRALGEEIPNAANMTEEYLRGSLAAVKNFMKKYAKPDAGRMQLAGAGAAAGDGWGGIYSGPPPMTGDMMSSPYGPGVGMLPAVDSSDERKEYIKHLVNAHKTGIRSNS